MTVLTMEDRYAQVLLLFGPPPAAVWRPTPPPNSVKESWRQWHEEGKHVYDQWQKPVQEWLFEQGITRSRTDGSWLREFCKWHRRMCDEQ